MTPTLLAVNPFPVILRHGASINGTLHPAGEVVRVDAGTARRLAAAGIGELQDPADLGPLIDLAGANERRQVFTR
ncbi:MAG: hypothetical protein RLY71_3264 [Pseudomonadota bacterium]|jgi:hypothetical protein